MRIAPAILLLIQVQQICGEEAGDATLLNTPAQPVLPPLPPPPPPPPPPRAATTMQHDRVEVPKLTIPPVIVPPNFSLEGSLYTRTKRLSKKAVQAYEKSFTMLRGELQKQKKTNGQKTARETAIIDHKRRQTIEIQMSTLCKAAHDRRECTISELMLLMIARNVRNSDGYDTLLPKRDTDCPKLEDVTIDPEKLSIHEKLFRAECQSETLKQATEYHDKLRELLEALDSLSLDSATCHQTIGIVVGNKGLEALVQKAREMLKHSGVTYYGRNEGLYDYIPLKVLLEPMAQLTSRRTKKTYLDFVVEQLVQNNRTTQLMLSLPDQMDQLIKSDPKTRFSQLKTASQIECTNLESRAQTVKAQIEQFAALMQTIQEETRESDDPLKVELFRLVETDRSYQVTWNLEFPILCAQIDEFTAHWETVEKYLLYQPILCPMKELDAEIPKTFEERYNSARFHPVPSGFQYCKGQKTSNRLLYLTLGVIGELVRAAWMKMIDEIEDGKSVSKTKAPPKQDLLIDLLKRVPRRE